jgi:phage baseplate assembly protein W
MLDDIQGPAFPFRIDPATGGVAWATGSEKIRQNVRLILGVRLGERPMLRDFGSRISALVHEPNDDVMADLIQNQTREALLQWEPRILVTAMQLEQQEGEARMRINYVHSDEPVANQMLLSIF